MWYDVCLVRIGYIYMCRDFMANVPSWNPGMGHRWLKYVSHEFDPSYSLDYRFHSSGHLCMEPDNPCTGGATLSPHLSAKNHNPFPSEILPQLSLRRSTGKES